MKLSISKKGVFVGTEEIPHCERVDIMNINATGAAEITVHTMTDTLRYDVDEIEICYSLKKITE